MGLATVADDNLGQVIGDSLTSPLGIALQILMLAGLVALLRLDWRRILEPRLVRPPDAE